MTLRRLRRNTGGAELGEDIGEATAVAGDDVQQMRGVLEGLVGQRGEGTLVPVVNHRDRQELSSTRHRRYGVNV